MTIWLMGYSGAGKSTLASALKTALKTRMDTSLLKGLEKMSRDDAIIASYLSKNKGALGTKDTKASIALPYNIALIDGDSIRELVHGYGYKPAQRTAMALKYAKICEALDDKQSIVIVAAIGMSADIMANNRRVISSYYEVFLDTPLEEAKRRDAKGLYHAYESGLEKNVVGLDIAITRPSAADLILPFNPKLSKDESLRQNTEAIIALVADELKRIEELSLASLREELHEA